VNVVCALCVSRECAVRRLQRFLALRKSVMDEDAVETSCGRCMNALRTFCARCNCKYDILAYFAASPQRANRFSERCSNALASPFGVTGALDSVYGFHNKRHMLNVILKNHVPNYFSLSSGLIGYVLLNVKTYVIVFLCHILQVS